MSSLPEQGELPTWKKIKISFKRPNPHATALGDDSASAGSVPSSMRQLHGNAEQSSPHVSKTKIAGGQAWAGVAGEESFKGPKDSLGAAGEEKMQTRAKRDRQAKAIKNADYDYNDRDGLGESDMLEEDDDDYGVPAGKPRRSKGKKQGSVGQVGETISPNPFYVCPFNPFVIHCHTTFLSLTCPK